MSPALLRAQGLYRSGKFDLALAEYNAITIANGPDTAAAYAGLARVYMKQKKLADAFTAAQKAVALDAHLPAAHVALAEVYFRQGKLADAEHEFQVPFNHKIPDARGYLGLGRIYEATSNYKSAKTMFEKAHALDPDDPGIQYAWIGTLSTKDRIVAIQQYLAAPTNGDDATSDHLKRWLTVLQDRASRGVGDCHLKTEISSTAAELLPMLSDPHTLEAYGLGVKVNGGTSARLLLDTGAGGILLNSKIAKKAGVKHIADWNIGGFGDQGPAAGYVGYAESIKIGDLEFENCYVGVVDKKSSMDRDGYIGANIFDRFLVDIDFPDAKLKLTELPGIPSQSEEHSGLDSDLDASYPLHDRYIAAEMKSYTRVYRFGHDLLIPTGINSHPPKLFLFDTGTFDDTISPNAARETTRVYSDTTRVKGFSGEVKKVYIADNVELAFGRYRQRKPLIAFDLTSASDDDGTEISGVLGFAMLYMLDIKIDYRDGLIDFNFSQTP